MLRLNAPLDALEQRELPRGDRDIGLARGQYSAICCGGSYDLELDAAANTPVQNAMIIRDALSL